MDHFTARKALRLCHIRWLVARFRGLAWLLLEEGLRAKLLESTHLSGVTASSAYPSRPADPLRAVERLAEEFAATAAERDRQGGTAKRERDRLRASGLLALSIPEQYGGYGADWPTVLQAVRILARADGSLAHLFGFQHLMLATARLFGRPEQWQALYRRTASENWFWGNALNPLDERSRFQRRGDGGGIIDGQKSFCSGAADSDMLIVSAREEGSARLLIAAIPTTREGITVHDDWDNMGQRQTDSGSVSFRQVAVAPEEILDTPGPLSSPFASLRTCLAQLILVNIYQGLAEGAFAEARRYTRSESRPWHGAGVARAVDDPYVIRHYGEFWVELESARALADAAAAAFEAAWRRDLALTAEERARTAVAIATAKVAAARTGLALTSRIFDVMGARATARRYGFDRFWRNLRTHSLHDPLDYKLAELGRWALNDEPPTPGFYS